MSKKWFTNNVVQVLAEECPDGFRPGRLPVSEETRKKHSKNNGWKTMTAEQKEARAKKISNTINNRTKEEKHAYSEKISKARKGKGIGVEPWNKGKTGLQKAWNIGIACSEETKLKISQTKLSKPDEEKAAIEAKRLATRGIIVPHNKGQKLTEAQKIKIKTTLVNKPSEEKRKILEKQYKTKKQNNTFVTSADEEAFYEKLLSIFPKEDIIRQYKEERYPFRCDFYIKSLDLFIELNFNWTHGFKLFEGTENDLATLQAWQKEALESNYYKNAIETWTQRDPAKFNTATKNNLRYLVYYSKSDLESFEEDLRRFQ